MPPRCKLLPPPKPSAKRNPRKIPVYRDEDENAVEANKPILRLEGLERTPFEEPEGAEDEGDDDDTMNPFFNPKYEVVDDIDDFHRTKTMRKVDSSDLARAEWTDDIGKRKPKRNVLSSKSTNNPPRPHPSVSTKTRPEISSLPPRISKVTTTSSSAPKTKVSRAIKSKAGKDCSETIRTHDTTTADAGPAPRKSPMRSANTSTCVQTARKIVCLGDVDQVIDTRPPQPTTSSSPTSWLKEKVAGVKRAASKLLGHHIYESLDEGSVSKRRKDSDVDLDSFGEAACHPNILLHGQDELTLPAGSYVVTYRGPDTVVDNAPGYFRDPEGMEGIIDTPPVAQSTPRMGWHFPTKGQGKSRKAFSVIFENEDEERQHADLKLPTARKIQIVQEAPSDQSVEDVSSDKPDIQSKPRREKTKTSGVKVGDSSRCESAMDPPAKIGTARRIVRKAVFTNLHSGAGAERGHGRKNSRVFGEDHGTNWDSAVDVGMAKRT